MIRTVLFLSMLAVVVVMAAAFALMNPGTVQLNLWAIADVEVLKSQAFALTFALGWLLGTLSGGVVVLRLLRERHKLRKAVRRAQAENENLHTLPLGDGS